MLETNKPYMFGSSTTTTTTAPQSSQTSTTNHLPVLQQHHHNNFYYGNRQEEEVEQEHYTSYHGQPARLNSAFGRHLDNNYTYKDNNTSFTRPIVYSSPPVIKREEPSLIIPPTKPPVPLEEPAESSWFDNSTVIHSDGLYADSSDSKRIKRRKEMTSKMEKLNLDFLDKKEG